MNNGVLLLIGIFALTAVVVAVVGFLGNKVVDGTSNTLRSAKHRKGNGLNYSREEKLGARYGAVPGKPAETVRNALFCSNCGARLEKGASACPRCGSAAETYKTDY